jgi:TRAP-type C4-dicarboxylate transport system substrate-binding protein
LRKNQIIFCESLWSASINWGSPDKIIRKEALAPEEEKMNSSKPVQIILAVLIVGLAARSLATELKIATLSPEGSFWMQKMREGAEEVAQRTDSHVRFKFYPGGVMGNDTAVLRKIRIGQLHGGAITAGSLTGVYGDIRAYSLPLVFKSFQEVDYVRQQMDSLVITGLEKRGFVSFGLAEGGFAYIMSKAPIHTSEDLRQRKVWMPDNDLTSIETMKAFGIQSIPLPFVDVRAGLQTGLVDTVAISPYAAIVLQWHTQLRYITDLPLAYVFGLLAIDQGALVKIAPDDQQIMRSIMGRVFTDINRQNREENLKALDILSKHGIQIVKPADDTQRDWSEIAAAVTGGLIKSGELSRDIVKVLENHLNNYRSQRANTDG